MIFYLLSFFWFIRETKSILFWLYLWQLKEYHIGRFLDHFRTEKGKYLLINKLVFLKIFLVFIFFLLTTSYFIFLPSFLKTTKVIYAGFGLLVVFILWLLYFFESLQAVGNFLQRRLKKPILTKKTTLLILVILIFETLFLFILFQNVKPFYWFAFWLLIFDILTPIITSGIVLVFQPLAVLGRNQIIRKAKKKRDSFKNLLVIGITGSYGKTSTKEFLATILAEKLNVLKTKEHQNSEVGISQCILNDLKPEHQIFIVEMGAYNRGGIKLLSDIAKPKIGILTGINEQHMATFGSQENIINTKFELIESLPEDGVAIFNEGNEFIKSKIKNQKSKFKVKNQKFCSIKEKMDVWADDIKVEKEQLSFKAFSKDGDFADFRLNLLGAQNVINILLAACCAKESGMKLSEISMACQKLKPEQGGVRLKKGINGLNIIDSTYSANPDGVIAHLEYLKIWSGPEGKPLASYGVNKKIIVMPCLIELGKASKDVHKRIGQKIGEVCDLAIITTKERSKELKEGTTKTGMRVDNVLFLESPELIFEKIKSFCQPSDVVLLESRIPVQLISLLIQ